MKKYFIIMLAAAAAAVACNKESLENHTKPSDEVKYVEMTLTASFEKQENETPETKTSLSGGEVKWLKNDIVSIFDNSGTAQTHKNRFSISEDLNYFTGAVPDDATEFFALYPNISESKIDLNARTITTVLNPIQRAAKGTFASNTAIMFGKVDTDNKVEFKNLCSHIRFTLASDMTDVKSITLMGNNDEILAGSFTISLDGETIATTSVPAQAETYVTLRNTDGSALEAGDYYFTTLPVEFKNGFTVIISKTDGKQVAKKASAAYDQIKERNGILVMKKLASNDYAEHMNYFVKYNDGFDLTFGGVTFNNTTKPGGVLVSDNRDLSFNLAASDTGVYFISPNCTKASMNRAYAYKSLIVIGTDASVRSNADFYRQARPYDGGELILMANIRFTTTATYAFAQNSGTTEHAFKTFGSIVLSNCHFKKISNSFFNFNTRNSDFNNITIQIEDCEFGISGATMNFINIANKSAVTAQNISFKNNIFYAESADAATQFRLISGNVMSVDDFNLESTTFDSIIPQDNLIVLGDINNTFNMQNNIFYECNKTGNTTAKIVAFKINANVKKATGTTTNNFSYNSTTKATVGAGIGSSAYETLTIHSFKNLNNNPISSIWNPANEVYGAYNEATYTENNAEKTMSKDAGAKRADMTATPSTSATANSADYRNGKVDLGTF